MFDLNRIAPGTYMVKWSSDSKVETMKLFKK